MPMTLEGIAWAWLAWAVLYLAGRVIYALATGN